MSEAGRGWSRLARAVGDDVGTEQFHDGRGGSGALDDLVEDRNPDAPDQALSPVADRAFIGRVMKALPKPLRGAGLLPARRMRLLAAFHLGGALLLLVLWRMVPELPSSAASAVHRWAGEASVLGLVTTSSLASWPVVVGGLAALFGVVLALAPTRVDTRPT